MKRKRAGFFLLLLLGNGVLIVALPTMARLTCVLSATGRVRKVCI